jgi:hypothetical protein
MPKSKQPLDPLYRQRLETIYEEADAAANALGKPKLPVWQKRSRSTTTITARREPVVSDVQIVNIVRQTSILYIPSVQYPDQTYFRDLMPAAMGKI